MKEKMNRRKRIRGKMTRGNQAIHVESISQKLDLTWIILHLTMYTWSQ